MGIPKYLEEKIKSIVRCCTEALKNAITPGGSGFLLRRPNDEAFIVVNNQATVGPNDVPASTGDSVLTGAQLGGDDIYESYVMVELTGTSPLTVFSGIGTLINATSIYNASTGEQYLMNGGTTVLGLCDATVQVDAGGSMIVDWSTTHTGSDTLEIYFKHTT